MSSASPFYHRDPQAALAFSLLATALVALFLLFVPEHPPYVVIDAETEFLQYRVTRPEIAALPVVDARTSAGRACIEPGDPYSLTGLIEPALGTIVRYRRSSAAVSVELLPGDDKTETPSSVGRLHRADDSVCALPSHFRLTFATPERDSPAARPLPIAGPAEIGAEFGSPLVPTDGAQRTPNLVRGGRVRVMGRALLPPFAGALYPVPDAEYPIPPGGRLTAGPISNVSEENLPPSWYGLAGIGDGVFSVSATTISGDLRLSRIGAGGESERFALGALTRLFGDPSIGVISLSILTFSFVFQTAGTWFGLRRRP